MILKQLWAYLALCKVARRNGITVKHVIWEIEAMSKESYFSARRDGKQEVLKAWQEIPCKGEIPTALELVAYLAEQI